MQRSGTAQEGEEMKKTECSGDCDACPHRIPVTTTAGRIATTGLGGEIVYRCGMETERRKK